ncbi:hypothetical protein GWI34_13950 [Actinomadura sp. DSM 109109]|nr:hypothetical protein [Actinomadura lepetitiana]
MGEKAREAEELGVGSKSEAEIKRTLGIDSWRNLSKDKMLRFAAMMPDLDTEVAIKIIEQFPVFKEFATETLSTLERTHSSALIANKHSQDAFHEACREIREILKGQLTPDLPFEDRKYIIDKLMELSRMESEKDSENKKVLSENFKMAALGAIALLAAGVAVLGGKTALDNRSESDS